MENFMTAGACFLEPEEDDLRLVTGDVIHYMPRDQRADEDGNVTAKGVLVQEFRPRYDKDGFALCGGGVWRTICPLVDFPELYGRRMNDLPSMRP